MACFIYRGLLMEAVQMHVIFRQTAEIHSSDFVWHRKLVSYKTDDSNNIAPEYIRGDFFLQELQNSLDVDL